jgi:hypothetical protein
MDILKTFGPLIGSVAPTIATALGGPVAGMAVKALSGALFGHENGTEDDIMTALANPTGDQLAQLKKIDADFKVQMKSLDIDLERIAENDRDSARQMQIATRSWLPEVLAILVTAGFFGIIIFILKFGLPESGKEAILLLVGSLGTAWTGVMAFYFGSSAGSKQKTEALTAALSNGK